MNRRIKQVHKIISVVFSLLFLIVAISGIVLNHGERGHQQRFSVISDQSARPAGGQSLGGPENLEGRENRNGRLIWMILHTGRYAGLSTIICDLTALALIITTLTGLYMYFCPLFKKQL